MKMVLFNGLGGMRGKKSAVGNCLRVDAEISSHFAGSHFGSHQGARGTPTHRGMTDADSELSEVLKVSREMRERNNAAEGRKGPGLCYSKVKRGKITPVIFGGNRDGGPRLVLCRTGMRISSSTCSIFRSMNFSPTSG
jgi:hypothetical protein